MPPQKPITQAQIAREAGVSPAVVSVVLSGTESSTLSVSADTRLRVLTIADQLGYVARSTHQRKRDLSPRRKNVLFVSDVQISGTNYGWVEQAYESLMGKVASTTGKELNRRGVGFSVYYLNEESHDLIQWLAESDISGVIWNASEQNSVLMNWIAARYPFVSLNRSWKSTLKFDTVSVNQEMNIVLGVDHLISLGHQKIATFGQVPGNSVFERRIFEYRSLTRQRGLRDYSEFQQLPDEPHGVAAEKVAAILDTWESLGAEAPTAIILSDVFALPLLGAARDRGISVPDELSVIGIDNTPPCALLTPPLTSIEEPFEEICLVAVELLHLRMQNPERRAQSVQIAPELIIRGSVKDLRPTAPARQGQTAEKYHNVL